MEQQKILPSMVDIHCHLLPGIDDGPNNLEESLKMARMAVDDGIKTIIVTAHQLGSFQQNTGDLIRQATVKLQYELDRAGIPLRVLPGADVRIEEKLASKILSGKVLSLADQKKHVLLELPHELYFPLEPILQKLKSAGMVGILSHPERNQGILQQPAVLADLVKAGCLMQITAGILTGSMGKMRQEFCRWMLSKGFVHFVSTDAHGVSKRRPLLKRAFDEVAHLTDEKTAMDTCVNFPGRVAAGQSVPGGRRNVPRKSSDRWFRRRKVG